MYQSTWFAFKCGYNFDVVDRMGNGREEVRVKTACTQEPKRSSFETPDPKYNIAFGQGGRPVLINASSGKEVKEPIFILRAKDVNSFIAIGAYAQNCKDDNHREAVYDRLAEFTKWQLGNESMVKEPDTT